MTLDDSSAVENFIQTEIKMEAKLVAKTFTDGELPHKLELDLSYGKGNSSGESGVYSNGSGSTASANASWECFLDEVADPDVFDPPILNSSGIKNIRIPCSVSTIEGSLATSRIGNYLLTLSQTKIGNCAI